MDMSQILSFAQQTINVQSEAISLLQSSINIDFYEAVINIHSSKGRVVISGIGKSAIIAQKIVATMNSTGTPALFMHAADAIHGDLGMIAPDDLLIIISKSGESPEIKALVPFVQNFGNKIIAICGHQESYLAQHADWVLNTYVSQEACPNNLAPTTSTTAQMVMGDALAMTLLKMKGFTAADFAKYHPGGALGKQLYLTIKDLILKEGKENFVNMEDKMDHIIMAISRSRMGATAVLDDQENIVGIITDGDLRRNIQKYEDIMSRRASEIMSIHPKMIHAEEMAVEGVRVLKEYKISQLIVIDDEKHYLGMVHIHEMMKEGLV